ncbi:MAG: hypothetical protein CSA39_01415 [Flavobacteriales bacterium]|nr:MAG: hypothetical protein CR989_01625 [Flavobacteriales bacterium]PIE49641.1 MAG: hypothetical protein CSA39_01415 [Flavobacteriales bacterium]
MKPLYQNYILLVLVLVFINCSKEELSLDPNVNILGKWKIIENSLGPISYPGAYEEYLMDSILYIYNSKDDYFYDQYWFSNSLLYKKHIYINQITKDTLLVDIQSYQYEFLDNNTLRLDIQNPALVPTFIYKRIN